MYQTLKMRVHHNKNKKHLKLVISNRHRVNLEKGNKHRLKNKNHNYVNLRRRIRLKLEIIYSIKNSLLHRLLKKMMALLLTLIT